MHNQNDGQDFFGTQSIGKILLKIAPPVMLAQLIQALYNVVDSFFVGRYSDDALTAVTVIYPLQLIIVALAVGTGVGVNTYMARKYAQGSPEKAREAAGTGMVLAFLSWAVFSLMTPVFFQAIGNGFASLMLSLTRQIFVLVPMFFLFSRIGLAYSWIAFPVAETVAGVIGIILYAKQLREWHCTGRYKQKNTTTARYDG